MIFNPPPLLSPRDASSRGRVRNATAARTPADNGTSEHDIQITAPATVLVRARGRQKKSGGAAALSDRWHHHLRLGNERARATLPYDKKGECVKEKRLGLRRIVMDIMNGPDWKAGERQ